MRKFGEIWFATSEGYGDVRDGDDQNRARQAARERGAKVLKGLMERAGVTDFAELERRSQLAGGKLSDQTISNALGLLGIKAPDMM